MPCYSIREVQVEFKVGNLDLLKKALEKSMTIRSIREEKMEVVVESWKKVTIDFKTSKITSSDYNAKELGAISNQIKRAYSEQVIDEIAKRQKWMKKKLADNRYQLQRF